MPDTPIKYRWMDAISSEHGPEDPLDRLILLNIAKLMNPDGSRARPSQARLAMMCGLTRETVNRRLRALEGVWIGVLKQCGKPTHYLPSFPEGCDPGITPTCDPGITPPVILGSHDFSISPDTSPARTDARSGKERRRARSGDDGQLRLGRHGSSLRVQGPAEHVGGVLPDALDGLLREGGAAAAEAQEEARR